MSKASEASSATVAKAGRNVYNFMSGSTVTRKNIKSNNLSASSSAAVPSPPLSISSSSAHLPSPSLHLPSPPLSIPFSFASSSFSAPPSSSSAPIPSPSAHISPIPDPLPFMPRRRRLSPYERVSTIIDSLIEELNIRSNLKNDSRYINYYIFSKLRDILSSTIYIEFIDTTIYNALKVAINEMVKSDEYEKANAEDAAALKKIIMDYTLGIKGPMSDILMMTSTNSNTQNVIDILNVMQLQWKKESNRVHGGRRRLRSRRRRTNRRNTRRRR